MGGTERVSLGIDFDNTIVCYDGVFHKVALELGLIPESLPVTKESVRDHLRRENREEEWTKLQGYVYGSRMGDAQAFPGVFDLFQAAKRRGVSIAIVSHKTKTPYLGPAYDLHASALNWMEASRFFEPDGGGLNRSDVYLELTKQDKLRRIGSLGCRFFIDDLPEFLGDSDFPEGTQRVLFSPGSGRPADDRWRIVASWAEFSDYLFEHEF